MALEPQIGYYGAGEARAKLGIPNSTFCNWVKKGKINKYVAPGNTRGTYKIEEIEELAAKRKSFQYNPFPEEHEPKKSA